jgi:hypothetical protein
LLPKLRFADGPAMGWCDPPHSEGCATIKR